MRLHEKGGKEHAAPCVSKLEAYLDEYIGGGGDCGREGRAAVPHHGARDRNPAPHATAPDR